MDREQIDRRLTEADRLACFRDLGFQINGEQPDSEGWIGSIMGPPELGEGERGNFSANMRTGACKDFGSTGYTGDLFSAVQDVLDLTFPEAVEWIVERAGITSAGDGDAGRRPPEKPRKTREPKRRGKYPPVPLDDATAWSEALLTSEKDFESALRAYLIKGRGLTLDLIKFAGLGARRVTKPVKIGGEWQDWHYWLFIPHTCGEDPVTRYQMLAFDPELGDWKRTESGKKITRSRGSVDLYDVTFEGLNTENAGGGLIHCEGVIDTLSAVVHSYPGITETHGANKTTSEIADRVAAHPLAQEHPVTIAYDGDEAGRKGRRKAARLLSEAGVEVRIADLPDGRDVNDVLREGGREALQEIIDAATPYALPEDEADDENDRNDKNVTGHAAADPDFFPPGLYRFLPETLRNVTGAFETDRERAVFLTGALPVMAGACPNVLLRYGRQWQALNLFCLAVAPAGAGKGSLRHARCMGERIQERLVRESTNALSDWKERQKSDEGDAGPRPLLRSFYPGGDSSAAGLKEELAANPHGVIHETEIKTITTALSQDWGQYRDVLLKAAHNEPLTKKRKGEEPIHIGRPALSVALSGTPRSFREIITDAEDGLFSRCLFLCFTGDTEFRDMFADDSDDALDEALEEAAKRLDALHEALSGREEPLYVRIGDDEKARIVAAGRYATEQVKRSNVGDQFLSNVRRAALSAFRIAGLLRLLRLQEEGKDLSHPKSVEVGADDVKAGLTVALTCLEHAAFLSNKLRKKDRLKGLKGEKKAFFEALPAGTFDTARAKAIAAPFSFSERTAERYLKAYVGRGLLSDVKHGQWRKPQFAPVSFLSFLSF